MLKKLDIPGHCIKSRGTSFCVFVSQHQKILTPYISRFQTKPHKNPAPWPNHAAGRRGAESLWLDHCSSSKVVKADVGLKETAAVLELLFLLQNQKPP